MRLGQIVRVLSEFSGPAFSWPLLGPFAVPNEPRQGEEEMQFESEMTPKVQGSLEQLSKELAEIEGRRKALKTEIKRHKKLLALLAADSGKGRTLRAVAAAGREK